MTVVGLSLRRCREIYRLPSGHVSQGTGRSGYNPRMPKHSSQILELARRGADARYRELLDELNLLTLSFPHLKDAFDKDALPVKFILRRGRDKAQAPRKRRKMSAAARKAIGDAQRKRWAKVKATKKG